MKLTDDDCRAARPGDKPYLLPDGDGLALVVQPSGTRSWRFNFRDGNRATARTIGHYPTMSLETARRTRDTLRGGGGRRSLGAALPGGKDAGIPPDGMDPVRQPRFAEVARVWMVKRKGNLKEKSRTITWRRLELNILPVLGDRPIGEITHQELKAVLDAIADRGTIETSHRICGYCAEIFAFAIAEGMIERNIARELREVLPEKGRERHHPALPARDLPEFFTRLRAYRGDPRTVLGLELILHCFVREGELLGARRDEFDGDFWRIPGERMKRHVPHMVPLTRQSRAIVAQLQAVEPDAERLITISPNTMLQALKKMGFAGHASVHGFRSLASTVLHESTLWSEGAIERQLAHVQKNKVAAAYNRAEHLDERARMMRWYSDFLERVELTGKIDQIYTGHDIG